MIFTWESVLALMTNQTPMKNHGEPTHKDVRKLEKELGANLIVVDSPWGHNKGHLSKLQDAATFLARNSAAYTPPDHVPPYYLNIPLGTITAKCKHLKAKNETALGHWQKLQHVRHITINQIAEAIEPVNIAQLDDPDKGLNDVLVRDLLDHIRDRYCHIGQDEIDRNMEAFLKGIDPSLSLSIYMRKQENCQDFASDARVPISEATMVTTGTKQQSNVVIPPMHGRNGTVARTPIKPGPTVKPIGHMPSKKTGTFDASLVAHSGTRPIQSSTTNSPKNGPLT